LLGRACIKEAVRYWVVQQTGEWLYSSEIEVRHDAWAPLGGWRWRDQLIAAPEISLTHNDWGSVVAVNPPQVPVGVDAEQWGRIRSPELFAASLSEQERSALGAIPAGQQSEHLLALWCAKEAAAKCLGTGCRDSRRSSRFAFWMPQDTAPRWCMTTCRWRCTGMPRP
jgi:hypothetical protein